MVSSSLSGYPANHLVDESIRTYWSAATGNDSEWVQSDLGEISTVHAVQINYADQNVDSTFYGKSSGVYHRYKLLHSTDGKKWHILVDKSKNLADDPNDLLYRIHCAI